MHSIIAPSILAADFANLQSEIQMVNQSDASWIHLDIMDGKFVPNISFGIPVVEAISRHATKPLDVHLMIEDPDRYLEAFKDAGASCISVHLEACHHLHRTIHAIKEMECIAGVAINPHTPILLLSDIIREIDFVCLMSVNPGFGGQSFIDRTYLKVRQLRQMAAAVDHPLRIEIDGGVSIDNIAALANEGADTFVAGSSVFKAKDPSDMISQLKKAADQSRNESIDV